MTTEASDILVVDDDRGMRMTLVATLEDKGYRLRASASGREALATIQESPPDLVIADLRLPDLDGLDILNSLKDINPETAFILVTGYATVDTAVEALNEGAFAYLDKPFNMEELYSIVRNALLQQRLARENRRLLDSLQQANVELNQEVNQRTNAEQALKDSVERLRKAYEQATVYAQELRDEIAQRKRAERALARSERLRRLQAADEAKDQERKRLAEELHDDTLAQLSSVIVDLGFLSRQAGQLTPELKEEMTALRNRVRDTEQRLRQIVQGLFPSVLTNLGLMPALRSYLEGLSHRPIENPSPLTLEINARGLDNGRLPEQVEIAVYRFIQQGLINAIQHARAKKLQVELSWAGKELYVAIADDGVGFDTENLERTPASGHFGLVNLRDRIEGLDGVLEIESQPSMGTTLRVKIPTDMAMPGPAALQRSRHILQNQNTV